VSTEAGDRREHLVRIANGAILSQNEPVPAERQSTITVTLDCRSPPEEVRPADALGFITAQDTGRTQRAGVGSFADPADPEAAEGSASLLMHTGRKPR
jgi:hypothetical protein